MTISVIFAFVSGRLSVDSPLMSTIVYFGSQESAVPCLQSSYPLVDFVSGNHFDHILNWIQISILEFAQYSRKSNVDVSNAILHSSLLQQIL